MNENSHQVGLLRDIYLLGCSWQMQMTFLVCVELNEMPSL